MRYLVINTAVSVSTVALIENDRVISCIEEFNSNDLSSKIFFMIDRVFQDGNCTPKDLNKIFVVNGPGSFTGIRIGLSIAKTMAWALKIDLIPISSLELMASLNNFDKPITAIIDARRNYVYAGIYDLNLNIVLENQYIGLNELLPQTANTIIVSYDEFEQLTIQKPQIDYIKIVKKHENDVVTNCHFVNPVYLKLTEAEEKRESNEN